MPKRDFSMSMVKAESKEFLIPLLFLILLFFNLNELLVRMDEINYWDEAQYVIRGKNLLQGLLPTFAWSPFTTGFFALLYLPFKSMGNWLPMVASAGRILIYLVLFLSVYLLNREMQVLSIPGAVWGMVMIYPVSVAILKFQSDALFAVNSAFALWLLFRYRKTGAERYLWLTSMVLGFAALTRNDGLILFLVFLFLVFFVIQQDAVTIARKLAGSILPFAGMVLGYLLIYAWATGSFYMGTAQRTWVAFTQGQYFIFPDDPACQTNQLQCAVAKAEELYGSGEENNFSVLQAIANNPQAFMVRTSTLLRKMPGMLYQAYGGRTAFSLFLFCLFGLFELYKSGKREVLLILLLWTSYLPVYLFTFYRAGYFYLPYYIFFTLGLIGLFSLLRQFQDINFRLYFSGFISLAAIAGYFLDLTALYLTGFLLLSALWFGFWVSAEEQTQHLHQPLLGPVLILLIAGIILHGSYDPLIPGDASPTAEEQAIMVLFNNFPRDTQVLAGAPGAVESAHMKFIPVNDDIFISADSSSEFHRTLIQSNIKAIYVDHYLTNTNEFMWKLIEPGIGTLYDQMYTGEDGSIQVLIIQPQ